MVTTIFPYDLKPAHFQYRSEDRRRSRHQRDIVSITEIQNLLSNSKVRNVIHSGRITFCVLDELHSAFGRITFRGHGELHSALPGGAAASAGGQRLDFGPADYNSSPVGIADGNAVRWRPPDALESAEQPSHEPSALTEVGYSVRPGPQVSQPPGQPERHWSANHEHAALSRPAGPARKQAAAEGPARSKACQKDPGPVPGKSRRHAHGQGLQRTSMPTRSNLSFGPSPASVRVQRQPARSPQPAAGEVPIQVPTKRRSPSVLYHRQQQPRHAMERVRRSRTSAQSDLGEGCSAISGRAQWQI